MRLSRPSHAGVAIPRRRPGTYVALQRARERDSPGELIGTDTMTAATFHTRTAFPDARTERSRGFWARLFDTIIEARMRRAMREIEARRHLIPENLLKKSGYTATVNDDSRFPFTR